jgi:hypothetical protein
MVRTLAPVLWAISRQERPFKRISATWSRRNTTCGLPTGLPLLVPRVLARSSPALTRSEILSRSCLAIVPRMAITRQRCTGIGGGRTTRRGTESLRGFGPEVIFGHLG